MGLIQSKNYCHKNKLVPIGSKYGAFFTIINEDNTKINLTSMFDNWENALKFLSEKFEEHFSLKNEELEKLKGQLIHLGYVKYSPNNFSLVPKSYAYITHGIEKIDFSDDFKKSSANIEELENIKVTDLNLIVSACYLKGTNLFQNEYKSSSDKEILDFIQKDIILCISKEIYSQEDADDILSKLHIDFNMKNFTYVGNGYGILIKFL